MPFYHTPIYPLLHFCSLPQNIQSKDGFEEALAPKQGGLARDICPCRVRAQRCRQPWKWKDCAEKLHEPVGWVERSVFFPRSTRYSWGWASLEGSDHVFEITSTIAGPKLLEPTLTQRPSYLNGPRFKIMVAFAPPRIIQRVYQCTSTKYWTERGLLSRSVVPPSLRCGLELSLITGLVRNLILKLTTG